MSDPRSKKPGRRPISCPACKKVQPFTHTCVSCGFDIKSHALHAMKQRAARKAQGSAAGKPEAVAVPPNSSPLKRKDVVCPACSSRQSFNHTCVSCGFDIKGYVLRLKSKKAPVTTPETKTVPPPAREIAPTHSVASVPDHTIPPELFAEAEREILNLFVQERPEVKAEREILSLFEEERPDVAEVLPAKEETESVTPSPALTSVPASMETPTPSEVEHVQATVREVPGGTTSEQRPQEVETENNVSEEECAQPEVLTEEEPVLLAAKSAVELPPTLEGYPALDETDIPHLVGTHDEADMEIETSVVSEQTVDNIDTSVTDDEHIMPEQPLTGPEPLHDTPEEPPAKAKEPSRSHRPVVRPQRPKPRPTRVVPRRTPPPPPPPLYPEHQTPGPSELLSPGALARSAWEHYTKRAPLLTVLWLVALAGAVVPLGVAIGIGFLVSLIVPDLRLTVVPLAAMAGIPVALMGMSPGLGALIAAVADPTADRTVALYRGTRLWKSTAIVLLMTAGTAAGGSALFVVPGMLAAMAAGPALYIMFIERETGLMAFIKSFEYLKGRAANSMLKLLPAALLCIIPAMLVRAVPAAGIPVLLVLLLGMPYLLVYLHRMFENLRGVKGRIILFQVSRHVRMRWTTAAVAGAALPIVLALLLWQLGQAGNAFQLLASLI